MKVPARPILRYHGGKWELGKWIISLFPSHHVYVEPYGGAASVLLQKPRSYAEVYNDLDGEIVNLFRVIRESPADLEAAVRATPFSRTEYKAAFGESVDPVERARRTLVRSHMGHAGAATHGHMSGFRSRTIRSGSHPASQWRTFPENLGVIAERWSGVVVESEDALDVIKRHDHADTLFYCDPPYVASSRDGGSDYNHEMTDADHERLSSVLLDVQGMVILSGYHSQLYHRLYAGWHTVERESLAENAARRLEVLWFNSKAWSAQSQGVLFGGVA